MKTLAISFIVAMVFTGCSKQDDSICWECTSTTKTKQEYWNNGVPTWRWITADVTTYPLCDVSEDYIEQLEKDAPYNGQDVLIETRCKKQ